jgi:hypothetical protein
LISSNGTKMARGTTFWSEKYNLQSFFFWELKNTSQCGLDTPGNKNTKQLVAPNNVP